MKHLKTIVIAAAAAMTMTAMLGAGSASATVLCQEYAKPCPPGKIYPVGTTVSASQEAGSSLVIKNGEVVLSTCTGSSWSGLVSNKGGPGLPVVGSIETLAFIGCTQAVTVLAKGQFFIHYAPPNTEGTLTFHGTHLTLNVMGESCAYGSAAADIGLMRSGKLVVSPTLEGEATLNKEAGGPMCPAQIQWEADSMVTAPKPLYFKAE